MMTINDIVHSQLFQYPECRHILLPVITKQIKTLFELNEEVSMGALIALICFLCKCLYYVYRLRALCLLFMSK